MSGLSEEQIDALARAKLLKKKPSPPLTLGEFAQRWLATSIVLLAIIVSLWGLVSFTSWEFQDWDFWRAFRLSVGAAFLMVAFNFVQEVVRRT